MEQGHIRTSNVACDPNDNPYLAIFDREDGDGLLMWHDGEGWHRRLLLDEIRQARPGSFIAADGTVAFDREGGLYIALHTSASSDGWGDPGAEVVLLFSGRRGAELQCVPYIGTGDSVPCWQPSLEMVSSFYQATPEVSDHDLDPRRQGHGACFAGLFGGALHGARPKLIVTFVLGDRVRSEPSARQRKSGTRPRGRRFNCGLPPTPQPMIPAWPLLPHPIRETASQ